MGSCILSKYPVSDMIAESLVEAQKDYLFLEKVAIINHLGVMIIRQLEILGSQ